MLCSMFVWMDNRQYFTFLCFYSVFYILLFLFLCFCVTPSLCLCVWMSHPLLSTSNWLSMPLNVYFSVFSTIIFTFSVTFLLYILSVSYFFTLLCSLLTLYASFPSSLTSLCSSSLSGFLRPSFPPRTPPSNSCKGFNTLSHAFDVPFLRIWNPTSLLHGLKVSS